MRAHTCIPVALIVLVCLACGLAAGAPDKQPYGFRGFEIYKFDPQISLLTTCDVDGDGLMDLLLANDRRAKIEVLLRRRDPVAPKTKTGKKLPNDLVDDRFFERKDILTEKDVYDFVPADFNGDGKIDVAYYGKPEELVVAYGDGKGGFGETTSFRIEDVQASASGLDAGDLNGDGRLDLVMLGKGYTAIYYQSEKGRLAEPVKLPHAVKGVGAVGLEDLDGDGRQDLIHLAPASPLRVRVRFQAADGSLGAEVAFKISPWRAVAIDDVDPVAGAEVLVVQRTSGILRALRMARKPAAAEGAVPLGTPQTHAFEETRGGKPRSMAVADVNGDGRIDVVVTEPGTAQIAVYLQDEKGALQGRRIFPSLSNGEAVRLADLDGNGRAEVIVLASGERAVGVSAFTQDGRLPFPEMLKLDGVPKAMDTADLNGDGMADLAVVVEQGKQRRALLFLQKEGGGLADTPLVVELEGLKQAPDDLMIMDVDQDGRADLLLFDRFGPLSIRRALEKGGYEGGAKGRGGLVQKLARGNVAAADLDGDGKAELLVASKNFARALRLDRDKGLQITDQANGASPRSQIKGVVALDIDGDGKPEVALFDREKNVVSILERGEGGVFAIVANLEVGSIDYQALFANDVNGDGRTDLVVFGKNRFAILYHGGEHLEFTEMHTVESSVRDAKLGAFDTGDLNGDGKPDLAVLDGGNRGVQIFSYAPKDGFEERLTWRVYEKKMHEERQREMGGAREIVVEDFDGDGLDDIAILVHDRLIVYPQ